MPATTPNFAIPFPCSGDTIDCDAFAAFTQGIQGAITATGAAQVSALNRPAARANTNGTQTYGAGVLTTVAFNTVSYDNDNMIDLAVSATNFNIQVSGMYLV
ncbi:MAG: hypothetical protein ACREIE_01440, partial [Nitrospiraceae bacterium]